MKIPAFSLLFYIGNICGLAIGAYLVIAHSLYRIILLYCLFNMVLLWIVDKDLTEAGELSLIKRLRNSKNLATCLGITLIGLLVVLVIGNLGSIYTRPSFIQPIFSLTLVVVTVLALASIGTRRKSFFMSNRFLLPMMILISLFVNFSIYLIQPNPLTRPLFASVDTYRDFANAARIVKLSGFQPQNMVLTSYYTEFPVLPMMIASLSLGGGLSIQESAILLGVAFEILGVLVVWLLSTTVVSKFDPAFATPAGVLAVILVWLQPYFIDPDYYLEPLRLSIPLLVLAMYLLYQAMVASSSASRSSLISILILVMVIAPMHPTSAFAVIGFCVLAGLLAPSQRRLGKTMILLALVFFSVYLFSGLGLPYTSMQSFIAQTYSVLQQISTRGPEIIANQTTILKVSEPSNFMVALPLALVLSICTVSVAKSSRLLLRGNLQTRKLNRLNLALGILAFAGLAGGYVSRYFSLDMRYFAYPATGLVVIACAGVLIFALRNATISRMRGLILMSIVIVFVFSIPISPSALYEPNPSGACRLIPTACRLIPTESETAAGDFVSVNIPTTEKPFNQILADWPFYTYVRGVTYSSNVGIEQNVRVTPTMQLSPIKNRETFVIVREYYLQSIYLQQLGSYTNLLANVDTWNTPKYNMIYDSGSTWVYLGTYGG